MATLAIPRNDAIVVAPDNRDDDPAVAMVQVANGSVAAQQPNRPDRHNDSNPDIFIDLDPEILEAVREEEGRREAQRVILRINDGEWLSTANRRRAARRE